MKKLIALAGVLGLAMVAPPTMAHHSFAMFDRTREVTVSGTVREFQWSNPHAYIQLVAKDARGNDVEWSLEMGSPMYLYARGWRPRTLRPGSQVSVKLNPLRNGDNGGVVLEVSDARGNSIGTNQ
ncbi:hypothetical protein GCM10009127_24770 [Alteraurantiacibacter aestuarii]|uniref:DUF6152 family protein n=1 Tax=Alteraurantiacibacter aestuarii TaxID=650004 RepID=UPI0031D68307